MNALKIKPSPTQQGTESLPFFLGLLAQARPRRLSNKMRAREAGSARVEPFVVDVPGKREPMIAHRLVGMTRATMARI
jgi:hypothetical protein